MSLPAPTVFLWNRQAGNLVFVFVCENMISHPALEKKYDGIATSQSDLSGPFPKGPLRGMFLAGIISRMPDKSFWA
ncbi:MAG: hypothetical protein WCW40_06590 [Bacteroidota bacterium]